jgi:hypothetical protein
VSNWLTVPLFVLAWPVALLTGNLLLTLATFVGVYAALRWSGNGFGPADGKTAVGLAGVAPLALFAGMAVQVLAFAVCRLREQRATRLPGIPGYYLGAVIVVLIVRWAVGSAPVDRMHVSEAYIYEAENLGLLPVKRA